MPGYLFIHSLRRSSTTQRITEKNEEKHANIKHAQIKLTQSW